MKSTLYSLSLVFLFSVAIGTTLGQTRYDDYPRTIPRNADIQKEQSSQKNGSASPNFVPIGTSWSNRIISYAFQNGTDDIAGNDERQAIRDAFAIWAAQTELAFIEVCDPNNANIVFLWGAGAHGDPVPDCVPGVGAFDGPNNTLAHSLGGPAPNNCGNQAGDIHFDEDETWTLNIQGNNNQPIDLVSVAAHEIGHSLGLFHTQVAGSLMLANYTGSHRFLGSDDAAGIQSIYGSRSNNFIRSPNIDVNSQPICGSAVLVVDNVPSGSTLTWSSSNSSALSISSGGVATRQNNFNGRVTVTATINSGCGMLVFTKNINVGVPSISDVRVNNVLNPGPVAVNSGSTNYVQTTSSNDPSNYSLSASTNSGNIVLNLTGVNGGNCQINVSGNIGNASLNISASNSCGTNNRSVIFYIPSGYRVAPNPVKDNVSVSFEDVSYSEGLPDKLELLSEKSSNPIQTVDVKETFNRRESKSGGRIVFDVRSYPRGTYYLRVINPRQPEEKQVEVFRLILE